jgi:ligand-binding SRPBCC domain-containing protein
MVCLFYKSMVQFTFVTRVSAQRTQVADQFNQELLLKLKPPLVTMQLLRYDGQHRGDELMFDVGIGKLTQKWHGAITQHRYTEKDWLFRDEGITLPHPLKRWKHTHALKPSKQGTLVIDRVQFSGKNPVYTLLLWLPIAMMFWMRKPAYQRWLSAR